jgi:hypothetical protein
MTITFADGTRIDVPASAFDDFLEHDLKWVEFVHGRAEVPLPPKSLHPIDRQPNIQQQNVHRCPAGMC